MMTWAFAPPGSRSALRDAKTPTPVLLPGQLTIAKRIDTNASNMRRIVWPIDGLSRNVEIPLFKLELGVDILQAVGRRDLSVLQGQRRLDHTGNTTCRLGMTDIRLDGANKERLFGTSFEDGCQTIQFNTVSDLCTGAMAFHVGDILRHDTTSLHSLANNCRLAGRAR